MKKQILLIALTLALLASAVMTAAAEEVGGEVTDCLMSNKIFHRRLL